MLAVFSMNTSKLSQPQHGDPFIIHSAHEWLYHTTEVYASYSLRSALWVLLRPTRIRTVKEL